MDLIPKQLKQQTPEILESGLKSRGISIEGAKVDLNFLKDRRVKISLAAVVFALLLGGVFYGYSFYLNGRAAGLDQQINDLEAKQNGASADQIINTYRKITLVETLLDNHVYTTQFFALLEQTTLPKVQWSNLNLNVKDGMLSLSGRTESYTTLAKQITAFEDAGFSVKVSGISYNSNGVNFSLSGKFDRNIFLKK